MNRKPFNDIAKAVKEHRKRAGLTQIQLAELAGVGKASVWDIEHGKESVQLNTLYRVLEALNINLRLESPLTKKNEGPNR